jgi:peptidoglycan/xylan/chitin deacetylase (PgdA/CDA1 family)
MFRKSSVQMLAAAVAALFFAASAIGDDTVPSLATNAAPTPHTHGTSAELIRHHRLKHLESRLTVDPAVLREQCRYESEISTAPPVRKVVLTFDDGPEPGQTELILETLKRYNIPAVFFLIGHKVQEHPELVERIRAAGQHVIGNHSWDHPNFHVIDAGAQAVEVQKTRDTLQTAKGQNFFRYPFGNSTCETNALVRSMGYGIVGWHIDSCDWAFDHAGAVDAKEAMICGVLPQHRQDYVSHVVSAVRAHHGGIVLMHEIHPNTIRQLEKIIVAIHAEGYAFTSLEDPGFSSSIR